MSLKCNLSDRAIEPPVLRAAQCDTDHIVLNSDIDRASTTDGELQAFN